MAGRKLSGQELRQQLQWRHNADVAGALPQRGGLKDYAPDGSWLQARKLENFYTERREILLEERVHTQDSLSAGDWMPDIGKVRVTKLSGKVWKNFGHTEEGGTQWLYPEEALFLMDEGSLEVFCDGVPLSLQKAYSALLSNAIPQHHYNVYAHLCRHGYIVQRHSDRFHCTRYERVIGLDALQRKKQRKRKLNATEADTELPQQLDTLDQESQHSDKLPRISQESPASSHEIVDPVGPFRGWFSQDWNENEIAIDECHLPQRDFSNLAISNLESGRWLSEGSTGSKWTELKQRLVCDDERDCFYLHSPVEALWTGDVKPLIRPSQATTAFDVLSRLKIIENVDQLSLNIKASGRPENFRIIFDIFLPDANFRKSDPGQPAVCLCIARQDEPLPTVGDLVRLSLNCADAGTALMFAVVDSGDVTFYSFNTVNLPVDPEVIQL